MAATAPAAGVLAEEEAREEAEVAAERGGRLRFEHCRQVQLALHDTPACTQIGNTQDIDTDTAEDKSEMKDKTLYVSLY